MMFFKLGKITFLFDFKPKKYLEENKGGPLAGVLEKLRFYLRKIRGGAGAVSPKGK